MPFAWNSSRWAATEKNRFGRRWSVEPRCQTADSVYTVSTGNERNAADFTARVVPDHPSASVPLEASQILWQK